MNRRNFVSAALAGLGGFFFSQKTSIAENEELPYTVEEITESTETRYPLPESLPSLIAEGRGYRNSGLFIGKGHNIHTGELVEVHPFLSAEKAALRMHYHCITRTRRLFDTSPEKRWENYKNYRNFT